jgi:hypothetical protein
MPCREPVYVLSQEKHLTVIVGPGDDTSPFDDLDDFSGVPGFGRPEPVPPSFRLFDALALPLALFEPPPPDDLLPALDPPFEPDLAFLAGGGPGAGLAVSAAGVVAVGVGAWGIGTSGAG